MQDAHVHGGEPGETPVGCGGFETGSQGRLKALRCTVAIAGLSGVPCHTPEHRERDVPIAPAWLDGVVVDQNDAQAEGRPRESGGEACIAATDDAEIGLRAAPRHEIPTVFIARALAAPGPVVAPVDGSAPGHTSRMLHIPADTCLQRLRRAFV